MGMMTQQQAQPQSQESMLDQLRRLLGGMFSAPKGPMADEAPEEVKAQFRAEAKEIADAASEGNPKIWEETFNRVYFSRMATWKAQQQGQQ